MREGILWRNASDAASAGYGVPAGHLLSHGGAEVAAEEGFEGGCAGADDG